jgi:hypothetical protein
MHVEYVLQREDLQAFRRFLENQKSWWRRVATTVAWGTLVVALVLSMVVPDEQLRKLVPIEVKHPFGLGVIVGVAAMLTMMLAAKGIVFRSANTSSEGKALRVPLAPEGITVATRLTWTEIDWRLVSRVEATPTHLFLFLEHGTCYLVPRRAFADASVFQEFIRLAKQYQRGDSPAVPAVTSEGITPPPSRSFFRPDGQ